MMNKPLLMILGAFAAAFIVASQIFFIVDERAQAIVLQLGQPVGDTSKPESFIKGPGIHMKLPIIQNVQYFDRRVLSVDTEPTQVVISSVDVRPAESNDAEEKKDGGSIDRVTAEPIILETFARYKIVDPLQFLKTLRTVGGANSRLSNILEDATKAELGKTSLEQLLSPARQRVMSNISNRVNKTVTENQFGIQIVDARIVRADLTADLRTSTVRRMISELRERATEERAKGEELALEIRSTADKERSVILAEAERDAQIVKGQGDNEAITIYAKAFNKDKDFYGFIRSMEAYQSTLTDPDTKLILSPDSDFLRYFRNYE